MGTLGHPFVGMHGWWRLVLVINHRYGFGFPSCHPNPRFAFHCCRWSLLSYSASPPLSLPFDFHMAKCIIMEYKLHISFFTLRFKVFSWVLLLVSSSVVFFFSFFGFCNHVFFFFQVPRR